MKQDVEYTDESEKADVEASTNELQSILLQLVQNCMTQGSSMTILSEQGAIAKCTKSSNGQGFKIVILKDDKMLAKVIK